MASTAPQFLSRPLWPSCFSSCCWSNYVGQQLSAACCPNTMPALVNHCVLQRCSIAATASQVHCLTCNEHVQQCITIFPDHFKELLRLLHHVIGLCCQRSNELFRVLQESTLVPTLEQMKPLQENWSKSTETHERFPSFWNSQLLALNSTRLHTTIAPCNRALPDRAWDWRSPAAGRWFPAKWEARQLQYPSLSG